MLTARSIVPLLTIAALTACGGGAKTETNPDTGATTVGTYSGPAPETSDVQAFKLNVWDNLEAANRCGGCHGTGGQTPSFVRQDDINLAYAAANSVVNLTLPAESRLVTKVGEGHHCWLASNGACADTMTAYISAWAGQSGGRASQVQLIPPPIKDVGASKGFPSDPTLFANTVWPVLTAHCSGCHTGDAAIPQAPFFAAADAATAYAAVTTKIDLDTPANSRLVVRLRDEFHNCWSTCANDANVMLNAITAMAGQIPQTVIDPQLVLSKALKLIDGIVASGGNRFDQNAIARYEFKTGSGNIAYDTSGVEPALNLTLSGTYNWVGGWGVEFHGGKAQGSTTASSKLYNLIRATGEYSIEAWVVPASVAEDGPARIIGYSGGTDARNFTLAQSKQNYVALHRSSTTDGNGEPALSTADAEMALQASQQHVVVTFDPAHGRRLYVNGVFTGDADPAAGGTLSDWDNTFAFVLGNEVSGDRPWDGKLRMVTLHNRALSAPQIAQNFAAGVGENFYLLFSLGDLVDVPQSYILFEVSQFDSYSYLFKNPRFISLDPNASPDGIVISGIRIGVNGREAPIGQTFKNLTAVVTRGQYSTSGQVLSRLGAVIPLDRGPQQDEFFLSFEILNNHSNIVTEPAPLLPPPPSDLDPVSDIGLRTFDQINNTMAAVTQVSPSQSSVKATYATVEQQLPTVPNLEGFLSAHQMAIAQLAIGYCSVLVGDQGQTPRAAYFPGFNFTENAATAFNSAAKRNLVFDPLLQQMLGSGLNSQPDPADIKLELNNLVDRLTGCATGSNPTCATSSRTLDVVKASCAAVLGSAAMTVQ